MIDMLERGREAFRVQAWGDAYTHLSVVYAAGHDLTAEDLELLARAAYLTGRDAAGRRPGRAHQAFQERGDAERAA